MSAQGFDATAGRGKAMISISVIIPMHNSQDWIEETLRSVRDQTYPADRIETVVVDDASTDDSVSVARAFLARHGMRGTVFTSEQNRGVSAARNTGWQAARGDWIQFLDADDLLASNKLELQVAATAHAGDDVAVICSSWQRLGLIDGKWQPYGPTIGPELDRSAVLRVLTFNAGFLGPALIRKRFLETVSGFPEDVKFAEVSRLMLKIAAEGGTFIEARSALPLVFIRQMPNAKFRAPIVDVARQHMEDVVVAERMLREKNFGELPAEDGKELGRLSDWALSELYRHDQAAFRQYLPWVREVDPAFAPKHSAKLKLASRVLGYENAESVAALYRSLKAWGRRGAMALSATKPAAGT
jgi:glycosyltransferase involved in cell wall biosynthesis